jgi:hypothetical protein
MKDRELWLAAIASLIIVAVTAAHYLHWLGKGKVRMTILFVAGAAVIGTLRAAGIPPDWFDGGGEGFGLFAAFALWAFVSDRGEERSFGRPLLLGMATALLVVNVAAHF